MNINPFIQTAFGAIVGGLVVIATSWLNTRREKRKEIQEWYEQRYVTEGIDPLIVYLSNLIFRHVKSPDEKIHILPDAILPVEALTRIEVLLGINGGLEFLSVFIAGVVDGLVSSEEYQDIAIVPLFNLCEALYQLRQEVLRLIPLEIHRKNQELHLSEYRDKIALLILKYEEKRDALILKETHG